MKAVTRRHMLSHGATAFALMPGFAHAAAPVAAAPMAQTPPPDDEQIRGQKDLQNRLTIETHINGSGPFQFVVDTGADTSVITYDVAAELGLINGDDVIVQGIARSVQAPTVKLKSLSFGHITLEDIETPLLRRDWLGADGYLGLDAIKGRRVVFDFRNRTLTVGGSSLRSISEIMQNHSFTLQSGELVVRMSGTDGRLTAVDSRVDGVPTVAFIDSGAQMSIGNSRLFAELAKRGKTYVSDAIIPVLGVTGGQSTGRLTTIDKVRFGNIEFINSVLLISDLQIFDVWGLADEPAMFLGMNFLKQTSSCTIDYGRKEAHFTLAQLRLASRA